MNSTRTFRFFDRPHGEPIRLTTAPRLASWDASTHPAQVALREYLRAVSETLVSSSLPGSGLSLMLSVGLEPGVDPIGGGRDLDNYLFPLVHHLGSQRFDSVWGRKAVGHSEIAVGDARELPEEHWLAGWKSAAAITRASASTTQWKEEILAQVIGEPAEEGPVELHIAFRVGPTRNWANLWKPAIDALENVLGVGPRRFHPRDDRVVILGLHRTVDPSLRNTVELGLKWRNCGPEWT